MADNTSTKAKWSTRGGRRRAAIALTVLVVILVVISFAPTYLARHLMGGVLEDFGVDYQGVDTLRINVWKREAWFGPLRFRAGENDYGELARLGVTVSLLPFVKKRALVERVILEGIDIVVTRAGDNTIRLNGIPLQQFLRPETGPDAPPGETATSWGTGLAELELRDTRVIFRDKTGGVLTVEVERLLLADLMTWEPHEEGSFELEARINDIEFNWVGRVRPFATDITVAINGQMRGAELAKFMDFTGDLGFERYGGVVNTDVQYELTLNPAGRVEGTASGVIDISDIDFARPEGFALDAKQAQIDVDARFVLGEQGGVEIGGQVDSRVMAMHGTLAGQQEFEVGKLDVRMAALDAGFGADKSLRISSEPKIDMQDARFSGQVHLSMDALLNVLSYLQSISSGAAVSAEQTGLADWSDGEATLPQSDIKVAKLGAEAAVFSLSAVGGNVSLDLTSASEMSRVEVTTSERATIFETLSNQLEGLQLRSGDGKLMLSLAARTAASGGQGKGPIGAVNFDHLEQTIEQAGLEVEAGRIALTASTSTALNGATLVVYKTEHLPEAAGSVESAAVRIKKGSFALAGPQLSWQGEAEISVDGASLEYDRGELSAARVKRLELIGASANQDLQVATDALTITGLDVSLTRHFINGLLASAGPPDTAAAAESDENQARVPSADLVKEIQQALAGQGYAPGPVDGQMGKRTQAAIRAFENKMGLPETGRATEDLLAALQSGVSAPGKAPPFELKLGRFALLDGARIRFHDTTVEPEVKVDTLVEALEISDVDMADPGKLAQARFLASINEFTRIELGASASALGPQSNVEAKASIEQLQLPILSPYVAELGGVYMERGELNTTVEATATAGKMSGMLDLDVLHLEFAPLSEQDAKRLSDKAGLPIETVVGLLQDSDGRIKLKLPIEGSLLEPDIDVSSAINKAVGKTLQKVFPPTMIASMLVSAGKGAGGGITFEPVSFEAGSAELDTTASSYLEELATLLQNQPRLSLQVCGRATSADFARVTGQGAALPATAETEKQATTAVDESTQAARAALIDAHATALQELATERTHAVRRYLITEQGIDSRRVSECRITFDADDAGPPRVQVSL